MSMRIFKVLSALLGYPTAELQAAVGELRSVLAETGDLTPAARRGLDRLIGEIGVDDLYALQERYVGLFDRGRQLSLHLFEHLHGESRDRGQAMVDLIATYRSHGLEIAARELPDHLPLFLEFLAQLSERDALEMLADAMPIVRLLGARLEARGSAYAGVFDALIAIGGQGTDAAQVRRRVASEGPDPTIVEMDRIWEEEAVTFMAGHPGTCGSGSSTERPLRQMPRARPA